MPYLRTSSAVARPDSASFRILMICSSLWRFRFIGFFGLSHDNRKNSHSKRSGFSGAPHLVDVELGQAAFVADLDRGAVVHRVLDVVDRAKASPPTNFRDRPMLLRSPVMFSVFREISQNQIDHPHCLQGSSSRPPNKCFQGAPSGFEDLASR